MQAQKHIEEQLPESDQIIEHIEQAAEEQQQVEEQRQAEEIVVDEGNQDQGAPQLENPDDVKVIDVNYYEQNN